MTDSISLARDEVDEFLGDGGTGVLALADENESYAIPVSYGYDPTGPHLYVRLGYAPESEKRDFVERTETASLVVDRDTPDGWTSVVGRGRLEEVTEVSLDSTIARAIRRVNIPFVTIYDRPARELEFQLYRLVPEELTGRRERQSE
ncbi:hypothetical protein SAMN04488063_2059 [Halopelagius inordinatus]|uniref:Pyridoxamine 5'-phosphate oxidase n=1 Tax=Halopelagius inordinatus TaxID=553467 RepID=A0A1I2S2E3_9EURY|nr:pyridoxamine 5'-phosphate oxidase family protein [Halopelagius inordinatus]SFG44151.1 hypothetical protein SAMN04488063_2059 [Halopelagius inordinatus]